MIFPRRIQFIFTGGYNLPAPKLSNIFRFLFPSGAFNYLMAPQNKYFGAKFYFPESGYSGRFLTTTYYSGLGDILPYSCLRESHTHFCEVGVVV